jgi:hypothetical protein
MILIFSLLIERLDVGSEFSSFLPQIIAELGLHVELGKNIKKILSKNKLTFNF